MQRKGELPKGLVLGLAYNKGGARIIPNDVPEILNLLKELWTTNNAITVAEGVLGAEFIWGEDLNKIAELTEVLKGYLNSIQEKGMLETVKTIL